MRCSLYLSLSCYYILIFALYFGAFRAEVSRPARERSRRREASSLVLSSLQTYQYHPLIDRKGRHPEVGRASTLRASFAVFYIYYNILYEVLYMMIHDTYTHTYIYIYNIYYIYTYIYIYYIYIYSRYRYIYLLLLHSRVIVIVIPSNSVIVIVIVIE